MNLPIEIIYEECDIPAEMTLREYRRVRFAGRHEARTRQGFRRFLTAFVN
ncbi:MAG TPA: hypothetical protein VF752_07885 [Thermoleophilaceae bacterium]